MINPRHKLRLFVGLCLACLAGLAGYFGVIKSRMAPGSAPASGSPPVLIRGGSASGPGPQILFRYTGIEQNGRNFSTLAVADLAHLDQPRLVDGLTCECVYFAAGHGICLSTIWGAIPTYVARLFDAEFKPLATIPLQGLPSRTRVSPDGRWGAFTVFLTGHGYDSVDFSTQTQLVGMADGKIAASLDEFKMSRDGVPFQAADFNFWGVTFTPDSRRFYCTLSSNRQNYLVEGDLASRSGRVIHENVECPSISPDGSRIAYKKRSTLQGRIVWQLHVLDLATLTETPLAENRSVDDQLEWLDDSHVLYAVSDQPGGSSATTNIWKADASGSRPPQLFLRKAFSPVVVR